jgi:peroxin-14
LIKPPTPPQLSQDKSTIDDSFEKAFSLLEQLEADTKALKEAEESRTSRLDSALSELETVVTSLKESDRRREDDARRNADELRLLKDLIPKALDFEKSATENRLKELGTELKSLKTLVGNRMGGGSGSGSGHRATGSYGTNGAAPHLATNSSSTAPSDLVAATEAAASNSTSASPATTPAATEPNSASFTRFGNGKAAIPLWQRAAAKTPEINGASDKDTSASGTVEEQGAPV